ncbi:hypothetical protein O6H91_18G047000 [Diphasiastrum complanatum]|uniref:Uncharacterized protein n=1 Tax=Diphasiastrum complanatum TaxID=34168 RepID=A0ACC2B0S5_DIPCM|nr:hypothetical protein O6H91_18G047000 [Diphasiastrum complanatum]
MRTQHRWDAGLHSYSLCFLILVLLFQCLVFPGFSFGLQLEAQSFTFKFDGLSEQLMSDGFTYITKYLTSDMDDTFAFGAVRKSLNAHTLAVWLDVPTKLLATVVWSSNRNQPVTVNGSMSFVANGSLVFNDSDGREVWSTHTDGRGGLGIRLQDSGNLVVYNDLNESVWQSFDFPTDTLLQGQVLSPGMQLVSSVSDRNLSEGSYSLVMATGGLACYAISPNPLPYWIWGYYGKNDTVSLKQTCQHPTQLTLASNRAGILIMSQTNATNLSSGTSSALCNIPTKDLQVRTQTFLSNYTRFLRIEPDGNLRIYVYSGALNVDYDLFPSTGQCRLPDTCGPYGVCNGSTGQCSCPDNFLRVNASSPSQGCYLKSGELTCNQTNTRTYKLVELPGVDYFPNKFVPNSEQTVLTKANCMDLCLQNCSCTSSFFYETSSSCFIFTDPLQTLQVVPDQSKLGFIKVQDQQLPSSNKKQALAGGVIGSLIAVCAFLSAIFWYRRKRNTKTVYRNTEDESFITMLPGILTRFSYHDLHVATEGFRKQLGAGGFGSVYEGSLNDGTKIAVKKLEGARQGQKEFRAEVVTIGSINHINLVRLRGFCSEGFDYLLVYEYMPNGSLEKWLFGKDESSTILNWQRRLQIALGTARGLAYLHDECRGKIISFQLKIAPNYVVILVYTEQN